MNTNHSLKRWQWITAGSLFTGYAAYYICRSNLSVATPLLMAEYADRGLTKEGMGLIASGGMIMIFREGAKRRMDTISTEL